MILYKQTCPFGSHGNIQISKPSLPALLDLIQVQKEGQYTMAGRFVPIGIGGVMMTSIELSFLVLKDLERFVFVFRYAGDLQMRCNC